MVARDLHVGAIVLAAGGSTRMGRPKQLLEWNGSTLLRNTVSAALSSLCVRIVVVLGANVEAIRATLPDGVETALNPHWASGMHTSIVTGVTRLCALEPRLSAVLLTTADQPFLNADVLNGLVRAYSRSRACIVASAYAGTLGTPALFDWLLFSELVSLKNGGARGLIEAYRSSVEVVPWPDGATDIDTPADYARLAGAPHR